MARSELLGKKDPREVGIERIKKRDPLEERRHKKELARAEAAFGDFVARNFAQRKDEKIEAATVQEQLKLILYPSVKQTFLEDARRRVKAVATK